MVALALTGLAGRPARLAFSQLSALRLAGRSAPAAGNCRTAGRKCSTSGRMDRGTPQLPGGDLPGRAVPLADPSRAKEQRSPMTSSGGTPGYARQVLS
jgi:hypothetical protein